MSERKYNRETLAYVLHVFKDATLSWTEISQNFKVFFSVAKTTKKKKKKNSQNIKLSKKHVSPNFRSKKKKIQGKKHKKRETYFIYNIFLTLKKIFLQYKEFF